MHGLITVRIKFICAFHIQVDDCIFIRLHQNHMKQRNVIPAKAGKRYNSDGVATPDAMRLLKGMIIQLELWIPEHTQRFQY